MSSTLFMSHPGRGVAVCIAVALASLGCGRFAGACEMPPDLHIEVMTKFEAVPVRNDYTLADIAALAHQQQRDTGRALLGFYASDFGYTIELLPRDDAACPARIETVVTLRLEHRLIELGQEIVENSCAYPSALQHYRRLAEVDEKTVEQFGARTAAMLVQANPALKQTYAPRAEDLDSALRGQIRAVVDTAIAPLHDARQDAQQAVNDAGELRKLASSCSI